MASARSPCEHRPQLQLPLALLLGATAWQQPALAPKNQTRCCQAQKAGGAASPAAQLPQPPRPRSRSRRGSEPCEPSGRETPPRHCGAPGGDGLVTGEGGLAPAGRLIPAPALGLAEPSAPSQRQPSLPGSGFSVAQNISSCSRRRLSILSSLALVKVQQQPGPKAPEANPLTFSTGISGTARCTG